MGWFTFWDLGFYIIFIVLCRLICCDVICVIINFDISIAFYSYHPYITYIESFLFLLVCSSHQHPHVALHVDECTLWHSFFLSYHFHHLSCSLQLLANYPLSSQKFTPSCTLQHTNPARLKESQQIHPLLLWSLVKLWVWFFHLLLDNLARCKKWTEILLESLLIAFCQRL